MKFVLLLVTLAGASAARNEDFQWGTWTLQLKGSSYTHGWKTTEFVGGFESDKFVVKEIKAGSGSSVEPFKSADWCKSRFNLPGVEALYTEDGHYVRTLSCDNQNAKILGKTFKAGGTKNGKWTISLKGSSYTHGWKTTTWTGATDGFRIKEIRPDSTTASASTLKLAKWCKSRYNLPGVEALYTRDGKTLITTLSCDNQDAHVLHAEVAAHQCSASCTFDGHHIKVTHDRSKAHLYKQHKCWHDGTNCNCECSN